MWEGEIEKCDKNSGSCKYKCCSFTNNFIVLYPGEFESSNLNKSHLKIIDNNYNGGKKVICNLNKQCSSNKQFKPFDCKCYPLFPLIDKKSNIKLIKGKKCPLIKKDLIKHKQEILSEFHKLIQDPKIKAWFKKVKLIDYEEFKD